MVHLDRSPGRLAGVASHAQHRRSVQQLRLWYVVARFARGCLAVVAAGAIGGHSERGVVNLRA